MARRRNRNPGGGGRTRHPNSLANLRPGGSVAPLGNTQTLKHGARSARLVADVSAEVQEVMAGIAEVCPVRDADGGLPDADVLAVEVTAQALKRWRHLTAYVAIHGELTDKGAPTEAAKYRDAAERAYWRALDTLGLSPSSRAALGLALARTEATMHEALADGRDAWQAREARDRGQS